MNAYEIAQKVVWTLGVAVIGGIIGYAAKKEENRQDFDAYIEGFNDGLKVMDEEWQNVHKQCNVKFKFGRKQF